MKHESLAAYHVQSVCVCVSYRFILLIPCFPSKKGPMSSCSGKLMKVLSFFLWPVCLEKTQKFSQSLSVTSRNLTLPASGFDLDHQSCLDCTESGNRAVPDLSKTKRMSCRLSVGGRLCSLILRVALCLL